MKKLNPDLDNRLGIIAIVGAFGVVIAVTLRDATFLAATIDGFSELTVALIQLAGVAFFLWFIVVVGQLVFQIVNNTFAYRKDLKNQKRSDGAVDQECENVSSSRIWKPNSTSRTLDQGCRISPASQWQKSPMSPRRNSGSLKAITSLLGPARSP